MLSVQHITTGYGKKQVLTDVSFDVAKGDVVLLTGGNGSGKSTVLKTIYGLLKPWILNRKDFNHKGHEELHKGHKEENSAFCESSAPLAVDEPVGRIFFEGHDITGLTVSAMIRYGIVYMPQKKNVFDEFTVEENLLTSASVYSQGDFNHKGHRGCTRIFTTKDTKNTQGTQRIKNSVLRDAFVSLVVKPFASLAVKEEVKERVQRVYETLPLLATLRKRTPFNMSGGERQLLAFGNALVHSPKLFLLDEPFAGVDVSNTEILQECIADLNKKGVTFIIVEHKRQLIDGVINKEFGLELGRIKL